MHAWWFQNCSLIPLKLIDLDDDDAFVGNNEEEIKRSLANLDQASLSPEVCIL